MSLPVMVDASGITRTTTDLGYDVEVTEARLVLSGLAFTVAGEVHSATIWRHLAHALLPRAHAHPGHYQGGEVTGEMQGRFVVDWLADDGRELGSATLIVGTYNAANFTFERATEDDVPPGDGLSGHTAIVSGLATSEDGTSIDFTFVVDAPEGRELVGAPFEATIGEGASGALHLRLETRDRLEGDTLFDGLDFAVLDVDADGELRIEPGTPGVEHAYNAFRRAFQTHDHYAIRHEE